MSFAVPKWIATTPFGVYCSEHKVSLNINSRSDNSLFRHWSHCHGGGVQNLKEVEISLKQTIDVLRRKGDTTPFIQPDHHGSMMYFCDGCYRCFTRKDTAFNHHTKSRKQPQCTESSTRRMTCYPTVCSRHGPLLTPHGRNMRQKKKEGHISASHLPPVLDLRPPPDAQMPKFGQTPTQDYLKLIAPFVRKDEDPEVYLFVFNGLLDANFESTFQNFLLLSRKMPSEEPALTFLVQGSARWISDHAALVVDGVPGSVRKKVLHFNLENDEQVSSNTFSLRRNKGPLVDELGFLIRFLWRLPTLIFENLKEESRRLCRELDSEDAFAKALNNGLFPRILAEVADETLNPDPDYVPVAVKYGLHRGFTSNADGTISLIECGTFGSRLATLLHVLRTGVTCWLHLFRQSDKDLWIDKCKYRVARMQDGMVMNGIAQRIKRLREHHNSKPQKIDQIVTNDGDIVSGNFLFKRTIWSTMIPRIKRISTGLFHDCFLDASLFQHFLEFKL